MAVIEVDFRNKSEIGADKTVNKQTLSPLVKEFICKFRQLNDVDKGRIMHKIDTLLEDYKQ